MGRQDRLRKKHAQLLLGPAGVRKGGWTIQIWTQRTKGQRLHQVCRQVFQHLHQVRRRDYHRLRKVLQSVRLNRLPRTSECQKQVTLLRV